MPVPSLITDLTTVAATNSPAGSESPGTADDYFRAHASFIAQLRDSTVKQSSPTDTTAGAVLTPGAFGWGSNNAPLVDPNTITVAGLYRANASANAPTTGAYSILHTTFDASPSQIALGAGAGGIWTRANSVGSWGAWIRLWDSTAANRITADFGSFGYGAGSGGTVTQSVSKSTAVTLNKSSGSIIMVNDALAAGASVQFQLVNSKLATTDNVIATLGGGGALLNYSVRAWVGAAGSIYFALKNESAGTLNDAVKINFTIIKGSES